MSLRDDILMILEHNGPMDYDDLLYLLETKRTDVQREVNMLRYDGRVTHRYPGGRAKIDVTGAPDVGTTETVITLTGPKEVDRKAF